ncbi:MAG: hypothetical protein U0229_15620 [Anaeromyxobacter sp.]
MSTAAKAGGAGGLGCLLVLGAAAALVVLAWKAGFRWAAGIAALPVAASFGYLLFGLALSLLALALWRPRGIRGLLVLSDSPHWLPYIEERWLPVLGGKLRILDCSDRARWRVGLASLLFRFHCAGQPSYCPVVIVLRGARWPLVLRFSGAFQLARRGDEAELRALEERLFEALEE